MTGAAPRIGYLVSRYPAVSHTFILREVVALRELGLAIEVASINEPDRPSGRMTAAESAEARGTWYVKKAAVRLIPDAVSVAVRHPRRFVTTLLHALRLARGGPGSVVLWLCYFGEAVLMAEWMRRRDIHHLHIHFGTQVASVGILAARLAGLPYSMTIHGPTEFFDVEGFRLEEKVRRARFVLCVSDFTRSQVMRLTPSADWQKLLVGRLGVDVTASLPAAFRPAPAPFRLLSVGRLTADKGQAVLIRAVGILRAAGQDLTLQIVGDGPDRPALLKEVADLGLHDRVTFLGALNQDETRAAYLTADAFALASFAEGLPVVLMEAMSHHLACIATSVAGVPELIRHGQDGLLVPPGNEAAMAAAIGQLMSDQDVRRRLGASARRRVEERHDIKACARATRDCFQELGAP